MTAVPMPFRRPTEPVLNHGAYHCPICWTPPLTAHTRWCDETTGPRVLAYPAEARVFRGLPIGLLLGITGWALAALFAFLIWSVK